MCKIMMMAGIKPSKTHLAWKWARAAAPLLYASDKDGFGYAATAGGKLFGERWLYPTEAFKRGRVQTRAEKFTELTFGPAVDVEETYTKFGNLDDQRRVQALMLHARFATCARNMENTHPFVVKDTALIHNGVISNSSKLQNKISTCDSECILNEYLDSDVSELPDNIADVSDVLRGYYACGVLTSNGEEQVLDVFKSERASLYVAWVPKLGVHVFCTSKDILERTARKCRMRLGSVACVNEDIMVRISVLTGRVLSLHSFEEEEQIIEKEWWDKYKGRQDFLDKSGKDLPALEADSFADDDKTTPLIHARGR